MPKSTQCNDGNVLNKWAPLSYPSTCIFSHDATSHKKRTTSTDRQRALERRPNPYFPLHHDVLCAAMRELLLLSGIIDAKTLKLAAVNSSPNQGMDTPMEKKSTHFDPESPTSLSSRPTFHIPSGDIQKAARNIALNFQSTSNAAPDIIPLEHQVKNQRRPLDYTRFRSSQHLVEYIVHGAIEKVCPPQDHYNYRTQFLHEDKEISPCELTSRSDDTIHNTSSQEAKRTSSKRKVSDVDDMEHTPSNAHPNHPPMFSHAVVELVRSNLLLLHQSTSPVPLCHSHHAIASSHRVMLSRDVSGSTEAETERANNRVLSVVAPSGPHAELVPTFLNEVESTRITDEAIVQFLRYPQLQKQQQQQQQQQQHDENRIDAKPLFVLPRLLKANIQNESHLRQTAHAMIQSILRILDNHNIDVSMSLRTFLGYKSAKFLQKSKLVEIFTAVLFDVSHAMHAWIKTEEEMQFGVVSSSSSLDHPGGNGMRELRQGNPGVAAAGGGLQHSMDIDTIIKGSLFDPRALSRIGGFEPASLLPLALGIRRCRLNDMTWEEYALTVEGKRAMELHCLRKSVGGCEADGGGTKSNGQCCEELLEIGKRRRGRRGRRVGGSSCTGEVGEASSFVVR